VSYERTHSLPTISLEHAWYPRDPLRFVGPPSTQLPFLHSLELAIRPPSPARLRPTCPIMGSRDNPPTSSFLSDLYKPNLPAPPIPYPDHLATTAVAVRPNGDAHPHVPSVAAARQFGSATARLVTGSHGLLEWL
jgi:hypothetical protein